MAILHVSVKLWCAEDWSFTGQVPPDTILSNDSAWGMPWLMHEEPLELIDSSMDLLISSTLGLEEAGDEDVGDGKLVTWGGRR
nr:hypothetical protein CFP56_07554 [Quercus suber]